MEGCKDHSKKTDKLIYSFYIISNIYTVVAAL